MKANVQQTEFDEKGIDTNVASEKPGEQIERLTPPEDLHCEFCGSESLREGNMEEHKSPVYGPDFHRRLLVCLDSRTPGNQYAELRPNARWSEVDA